MIGVSSSMDFYPQEHILLMTVFGIDIAYRDNIKGIAKALMDALNAHLYDLIKNIYNI